MSGRFAASESAWWPSISASLQLGPQAARFEVNKSFPILFIRWTSLARLGQPLACHLFESRSRDLRESPSACHLRLFNAFGVFSSHIDIQLTWVRGCIAIDFVAHLVHLTTKITPHLEV